MRDRNYILAGREYCKHDAIPRYCELCERDREIGEVAEQIANMSILLNSQKGKIKNLEQERDELKAQIKSRNEILNTMMETVGDCNEDSKNMTIDWKQGAIWVYQNIECAIEDARGESK
jgi:3-phosphoglycerate kinase